jgi:hypothetical protein
MYVKIKTNRNIAQTLRYHEQKLELKEAQCILAENFLKDTDELSRKDKLIHFQRLNSLNERTKVNTVHISMNFHPSEQLSNDQMRELAKEYMAGIGCGEQPFLVYRHYDANHPHMHLVSTKIREDGVPIDLWNVIRHESLRISRELEIKHSLVKLRMNDLRQTEALRINDGQESTGQRIEKAIDAIVPNYKYTNLSELNALLKTYHVEAYRGKEDSRLYQRRGVMYRVIDEKGQRISAPIKASAFESKPTLKNLEIRFELNANLRETHRQRLTTAIDWAFYKQTLSFEALQKALKEEKISIVSQSDEKGTVQNIWYVDRLNKAVFEASNLGQRYTATEILKKCIPDDVYQQQQQLQKQEQKLRLRPGGL